MAKYTHTHIYVYVDIYLFMQNMHIIPYKYSSWELYSILCLVKKIYTYVCIYICIQSINIDYENIFEIYNKYLHNYLC